MLFAEMDGTGDHHVKQSKPGSEGQKLHVLPHMWKPYKINILRNTYMTWKRERDCIVAA
jgi:hypothetical protein